MNANENTLIDAAKAVRAHAYAPYSKYLVGAALLDDAGKIHTGCNVENSAYPEGVCAEATAIGAMIGAGSRRIVAIAAVGGREEIEACTPCGGCRQKIAEFSDNDTRVILIGEDGGIESHSIAELLPGFFRLN
ncbi:MAG: cytidine deaminase [Pseudomonadales bacterium]